MSDKYYVWPDDAKPGTSLHWGDLSRDPDMWRYDGDFRRQTGTGVIFTPIPYCTFGDYDNSTGVERSNARVMLERFPELVTVTGDYGSQMIGYLGDEPSEELLEAIAELEEYPVADEDDLSQLEMEMEWEAWCDWGRRDFAKELTEVLNEIDPEWEHELDVPPYGAGTDTRSPLDEIWHKGTEAYNVNGGSGYVIEGGGGVHFYIDEWCKGTLAKQDERYPWSEWSRNARREMRDLLMALAQSSRLSNEERMESAT